MAINTAGDLIAFALRAAGINGVGQTPLPEDFTDGMAILSAMVAQWQAKRWLVPDLVDTAVVSTGAVSYSVGPGGTFALPRPYTIEAAFSRILNTSGGAAVDYPLALITAREQYNALSLKSLSAIPAAVFYDSAWPVGSLFFWPVPPAGAYELHITTKAALDSYVNTTDPITLPPVYMEALMYGLAIRLAQNYGLVAKPDHRRAYAAALATIRVANLQIAELGMPAGLSRGRGGSSVAASASSAFQSGAW